MLYTSCSVHAAGSAYRSYWGTLVRDCRIGDTKRPKCGRALRLRFVQIIFLRAWTL